MAVFQAVHAFALFTGCAPDMERMQQCFDSASEVLAGQFGATET
jgi:shikimate 5-dehydrogenase